MAIAAAALRVGSMLAKTSGAIAKGGKAAMVKGGKMFKNSKKIQQNIKKAVFKKRKINKDTLMSKDRTQKKKLERDKRKQEEELIEKGNDDKKKSNPSKIMKKGGGILQTIINFISTVLVGWVVVNLPKIIKSVKNVIKKIKNIFNRITDFFGVFGGVFKDSKDTIGSTDKKIKNLDYSKTENNINNELDNLKNAFKNLITDVEGGESVINSEKSKDPEKIVKDGLNDSGEYEKRLDNNKNKLENDTDKFLNDTNKQKVETLSLQSNVDNQFKKAGEEFKKAGIDINLEKINNNQITNVFNTLEKPNIIAQNLGLSDNVLNNKPKLNNDSIIKSNNGEQNIISNTKNNENIINNNNNLKYKDSNITPNSNKKIIVVDNIIPKKQITSVQNKSKTELIVVGKSLNSIIKESILTDAAFT